MFCQGKSIFQIFELIKALFSTNIFYEVLIQPTIMQGYTSDTHWIFENFYVLITLRNLLFPILPELFARIWSYQIFFFGGGGGWGGGNYLLPSPALTPMNLFHISLHVNAFANERKFKLF